LSGQVVRAEISAEPIDAAAHEKLVAQTSAGAVVTFCGALTVAVSHRVGTLAIGDTALIAVVSSPHREAAFGACARLVDELKRELPIWKRQVFGDGTDEWVNCP
jgi:molybdopterin synthase catalytic subunit